MLLLSQPCLSLAVELVAGFLKLFDGWAVLGVGVALHQFDATEAAAADPEADAGPSLLLRGRGAEDGLSLLGRWGLLLGRIEDERLGFYAGQLDRVGRGGAVRLEALVVAGRSRTLKGEGVLLFDSTISVLNMSFLIAIEIQYAASVLVLIDLLSLLQIHDALLGQYLQLFLLLLGGVADYYVVKDCFAVVLLLFHLQI